MANLLTFTEQFDNAAWTLPDGGTVSADTGVGPVEFGPLAKLADTINATSGWNQIRQQIVKVGGSGDVSNYTASLFVKKDAIMARFPLCLIEFVGATSYARGFNLNTSTGAVGASGTFTAPVAFGAISFNAQWWRVWWRAADPNSNIDIRVAFFPAAATTISGGVDGGLSGTATVWGANLTNSDALEDYTPEPFYDSDPSWTTVANLAGDAAQFTDMTMTGGQTHEWRVLASNAGGSSVSNHEDEFVDESAVLAPSSRFAVHHIRRDVFRSRRV